MRADMPASRQKLIHAGKVLKDDTTLRASSVADADFIVCMLTKEVVAAKVLNNQKHNQTSVHPSRITYYLLITSLPFIYALSSRLLFLPPLPPQQLPPPPLPLPPHQPQFPSLLLLVLLYIIHVIRFDMY